MNSRRLDGIARLFAGRRFRTTLRQTGQAVPVATPEVTETAERKDYLFVQSFQSGSIAPKEGEDGIFTLTLEHGLGQTIYFADRPDRTVGAISTPDFLQSLGFQADNPPNAALVVDAGNGETDIAVVALTNPVFDDAGPGITYDVSVLAEWRNSLELGFAEQTVDLAALAPSFGNAHLFIDDCGFYDVWCCAMVRAGSECLLHGLFPSQPYCWSTDPLGCIPCQGAQDWDSPKTMDQQRAYWAQQCAASFSLCEAGCEAHNLIWWDLPPIRYPNDG